MFSFYVVMNFNDATFLFQKMIKEKQLSQKNYCPVGTHEIELKDLYFS